MKTYFAYLRVSTPRQGEGVSLQEQRSAITNYAAREGLSISAWFEEKQTAARAGRPVFNQMLELVKINDEAGVILLRVDRGARNLRDWADIGELIDAGVDVRIAGESLDLQTRGGRLSADIQAVIAADFIRSLLPLAVKSQAHSGGTDARGGHFNRKTGEYHFHHGMSAHQHPGGFCPYDTSR